MPEDEALKLLTHAPGGDPGRLLRAGSFALDMIVGKHGPTWLE